jgi:hypothetical protein
MTDPKRYTEQDIEELLNENNEIDIYDPLTQDHYTYEYTETQYTEKEPETLPF